MAIIVIFHVVIFFVGAIIGFYGLLCRTSFAVGLALGIVGLVIVLLDLWSIAAVIVSLKR